MGLVIAEKPSVAGTASCRKEQKDGYMEAAATSFHGAWGIWVELAEAAAYGGAVHKKWSYDSLPILQQPSWQYTVFKDRQKRSPKS